MPNSNQSPTVASHFEKSAPAVHDIYKNILRAARELGIVREEPKKTSIHLVRKSAFAGIATRKDALILTLKSARAVESKRIHRREQVSSHRWHVEIRLEAPSDIDSEIRDLLKAAYEIS